MPICAPAAGRTERKFTSKNRAPRREARLGPDVSLNRGLGHCPGLISLCVAQCNKARRRPFGVIRHQCRNCAMSAVAPLATKERTFKNCAMCLYQTFGLRLASARMTEMRIAEACCVFEPVAQCAISPNMNDPDRANRKEEHIGE